MNTVECIESRRSVRKFKDITVPADVWCELVETARYYPSWKHTQVARYHIISNPAIKENIANNCVCDFDFNANTIKNAPALVVISYVTERCGYERDGSFSTSKEDRWEMFNAGIAAQTFCLAAHEKGIGTCIMGIFDEFKVAEAIGLPENQKVGVTIAAGYPNEEPDAPKRKAIEYLLTRYE